MSHPATPTSLATRAARHSPQALDALCAAFQPCGSGFILLDRLTHSLVSLTPKADGVLYERHNAPTTTLPLLVEDAKRWAAIDMLDAIANTRKRVQRAQDFIDGISRTAPSAQTA